MIYSQRKMRWVLFYVDVIFLSILNLRLIFDFLRFVMDGSIC